MFRSRAIAVICRLALCAVSAAAQVTLVDPASAKQQVTGAKSAAKAPQAELLPASFANWHRQSLQTGKDLPANTAALKEYGFTDIATATFAKAGRTLEVRAVRFADAGGAFGAFTFLRQPTDKPESLGDAAVATANRRLGGTDDDGRLGGLLFYRGNVLVEVNAKDPPVADIRALDDALPRPTGAAANLPTLPTYLPKQPLQNVRYFAGPIAAAIDKLPLSQAEVRWDDGAEVVWAQRPGASVAIDLVLISYPTPQMAAARLRDLQAAMVKDQASANTRAARRSGPIVVWVSGAGSSADAQMLAESVKYDARITWNEPNPLSKRENVGNLIVAALALAGIVLLMSLVAGLAFGGLRLLMKRLYPDKVFDRSEDVEIIRLHLTESPPNEKKLV